MATNVEQQPEWGATGQQGVTRKSFSYPIVPLPTGKVQYRVDGAEEASTGKVLSRRGEVHVIKSEKMARSMVASGQYAHVAWESPTGQPDQFRPKKDTAPAATAPQQSEDLDIE